MINKSCVHKLGHCRSIVKYLLFLYCLQDVMSVCGVWKRHDNQNLLRVCKKGNTTDTTSATVTAYPSNAHEFNRGFSRVRGARSLVFCIVYVDHCLSFFFWLLCCLFFFDLRLLITSLWYLQNVHTHITWYGTRFRSWSPNAMIVYILIALLILTKESTQ